MLWVGLYMTGAMANEYHLANLPRAHPKDLPLKRATDCGTWVMRCNGAEDACNNACYYINNVNPGFVATYSSQVDNDKERIQSGCQTNQRSVCNAMPFSQRFHDSQEPNSNGQDPRTAQFNCDEFVSRLSGGLGVRSIAFDDSCCRDAHAAVLGMSVKEHISDTEALRATYPRKEPHTLTCCVVANGRDGAARLQHPPGWYRKEQPAMHSC